MLVPFNFSGPTAPRHLQLAPPTSWLRPEGMPVRTDLRLFSTLVIYLFIFLFGYPGVREYSVCIY